MVSQEEIEWIKKAQEMKAQEMLEKQKKLKLGLSSGEEIKVPMGDKNVNSNNPDIVPFTATNNTANESTSIPSQ